MKKKNRLKEIVTMTLASALLFSGFSTSALAADAPIPKNPNIQVLMDGKKIKFNGGNPYADNNSRVQVPFRGVGEAMGAIVDYNSANKVVTFHKGKNIIKLTIGSKVATVNGKSVAMDTVASAKNGRTYVPLRFVSENLGEAVRWDGEGNMVWIGEEKIYTYEEVAGAGEAVSKYAHFYKGVEPLLESVSDGPYTQVHVLSLDQFPVKIGTTIIYDMWLYEEKGYQGKSYKYIAVRHSDVSPHLYYLTDTMRVKYRTPFKKDSTKKVIKTDGYAVVSYGDHGDNNPQNFTINQAQYIGFPGNAKSIVLLKNPWK